MEPPGLDGRRFAPVGAVHDDQRQRHAEPALHHLRVGQIDGHDPARPPGPAPLDPAEQAPSGPRQAGDVGGVHVDVPGVVDDRGTIAPAEVEADRDAHVGHRVDEICGRGDPPAGQSLRTDGQADRGQPDARGPGSAHAFEEAAASARARRRTLGPGIVRWWRSARPAEAAGNRPERSGQTVDRRDRHPDDPVAGRMHLCVGQAGLPAS